MDLPKGAKITHAGLLQHNNDGTTEIQKITQAGLVARSPEGTAAKGMNIRGNEDLWVEIQANTFRNWVNEHLRDVNMQVSRKTQSNLQSLLLPLLLLFNVANKQSSLFC
jgi:filamin